LADSPPSMMTSSKSAPCTVAMARILASWASSETPCSACLSVERERNRWLSSGHMVGNDPEEINEIVRVFLGEVANEPSREPLAFQPHRRDRCPELGILPNQEIHHDIEQRRTSHDPTRRPGAAAKSRQRRPRCATEAPCCGLETQVGKERPALPTGAPKAKRARNVPRPPARGKAARPPKFWTC
jgi:hypothetical protein